MDCCGEYRARAMSPYSAGAAAAWEYAPLTYPPYAQYYTPHDPYRYYRYDYSHYAHHNDQVYSDYGAYAAKETSVRRALAHMDARALTHSHNSPLPQTMGMTGWNGANAGVAWNTSLKEHMRYPPNCRSVKGPHMHAQNQVCPPDGTSTPYPVYEESLYGGDNARHRNNTSEFPVGPRVARQRERPAAESDKKRLPIVPLPAFQQAFGSTEIGKFAEAFSREVAIDDTASNNYVFDTFLDWDGPPDAQWPLPPASREIKCEENY